NPSTDAVSSFNTDGSLKGQGYAVVDKGDGTYTVTFGANIKANTKVPYDASLVHRIGITVRSVAVPGVVGKTPGAYAGPINQTTGAVMAQFLNTNGAALVYDFIPATGAAYKDATSGSAFARDIVTIAACNQCHYKIEFGGALGNNTSGHMGSRPDTKICVMCHTNQLAAIATNTIGAGATVGTGNFTNFIHQIHMGEELPVAITATTQALSGAIPASEVRYPQDIRNCTFCHQGADVDHWMSKPTRNACGSCHDNVNFATGVNHGIGGAKADDKACATCHDANGISGYHLPIDVPNPLSALQVYAGAPYNGVFSAYSAAYQANGRVAPGSPNSNTNASYVAAASLSRLPAGAKAISYVINSVSRNASKQPVMEFKFQIATADATGKLGTPVDVIFNKSDGKNEMITGFVGSPSIYWAFAVPQDGITAPVDYNTTVSDYLKRVWDGTVVAKQGAAKAATLTGPVNGYYTITMTGVTIPDSAVMLIGGIGYTYGIGSAMTRPTSSGTTGPYVPFVTTTQPLTQIDLAAYPYKLVPSAGIGTGGLSVPPNNVTKVATGYTGRRVITDNNKCNACHGRLGVKPTFHAGQRNDAPTCTFCHLAGATNSGWPININFDVHAIHGAAKRVNKFSWEVSAGAKYWTVGYPGVLKNCEQCHVAGMYDYSNSAYTANNGSIFDSMLYTTVATGTMPASVPAILTGNETVPGTYYSPFVTAGAVYGTGFSYTSTTGTATPTVQAAPTTLVNSPIASVCFSCHDTKTARSHMVDQGGSIYEARSTALLKKELCIVCHGALSSSNSTNTTTPAVKAVHRWW
ncbi:MAG: OmcA/MtrC family decaheme c-type cytochrome, partial [Desulfuromonadales bacterium]